MSGGSRSRTLQDALRSPSKARRPPARRAAAPSASGRGRSRSRPGAACRRAGRRPGRAASSARPSVASRLGAFVDDFPVGGGRPPHARRDRPRAPRCRARRCRAPAGRGRAWLIWKVRPRPRLHARAWRHARHVLAAEQIAPGARRERAHQHVDEGRLAGAVGPDERVARLPARAGSRCSAATVSAPKLLHSFLVSRTEYICPGCRGSRRGANSTTTMRSKPMPRYQYSGYCLAR